jgi:hypothetical protein
MAYTVFLRAILASRQGISLGLSFAGFAVFEMIVGQITTSPLTRILPRISIGLTLALSSNAQRSWGEVQ